MVGIKIWCVWEGVESTVEIFPDLGGGGGSGISKFLTGGVGDLSSLPVGKTLLCASWSYNVMVFPMILSVVLMFSLVILATTESAI